MTIVIQQSKTMVHVAVHAFLNLDFIAIYSNHSTYTQQALCEIMLGKRVSTYVLRNLMQF